MEKTFGKDNIRKWADLDGDDVTADIEARITNAIQVAEEYINAELKGGPYEIPFTGTVPFLIQDLATRLAAWFLYSPRGIEDVDNTQVLNQVLMWKKYVDQQLRRIHSGNIKFTDVTPKATVTYPQVVESDSSSSD